MQASTSRSHSSRDKIAQTRIVLGQELDSPHWTLVEQFPLDRAVEHVTQPAQDPVYGRGLACLRFRACQS